MPSAGTQGKVFYGWWVVIACAMVHLYSAATFFYGFGALFNPIVEEFAWSYALVSFAVSLRGFESGAFAPIVGMFVDKLGPRKLVLCGIAVLGLGFVFLGNINNLWGFYAVFVFMAFGFSLMSLVVTMTAVARWFGHRSGLAMGVLTTGFGAGGLLLPAVVWVVDQLGWRSSVMMFGVGTWLVGVPLALVIKAPRSTPASTREETSIKPSERPGGMTARQALREKGFWLLSTALLFGGIAGTAVIVHQIPYMVSLGISRQAAGFMAMVFAISSILGRLGFGWLGQVLDKRRCFAISASMKGLGVLAFALATSVGQFIPALVALGLGFGGLVPLRAVLQVDLFGTRAFGAVQGLLMVFVTVGSIVSPPFAGWMFDLSGSYRLAFVLLGFSTLIAVPTILATPKAASVAVGRQVEPEPS